MAERFEDTPELFGYGAGTSCIGDLKCEFCGTLHNPDETGDDPDGEPIRNTEFAGLQACECCFLKIENEVLHRMPDILKWYKRILEARRKRLERNERLLADACPPTVLETEIMCPCGTVHKYRLDLPSGQTSVDFTEPIEMTCKRCNETLRARVVVNKADETMETLLLDPKGHISNCALANADEEENCQVCKGGPCPDREKFGKG